MSLTEKQRDAAKALYQDVQNQLCAGFEQVDGAAKVQRKAWVRPEGGGGTMGVIRGSVVEKAGANFSAVFGKEYPAIEGEHKGKPFFATGVSTITHMMNPHAPIGHMNVRLVEVGDKFWFGGGGDMTPFIQYPEDNDAFHAALRQACALMGADVYDKYAKWCDEYFFIKHRNEVRGIGGVFFDYLETDFDKGLAFQKAVAEAYTTAFLSILNKRKNTAYTEKQKDDQLYWRGRYAEYNLVYDRGTKFGLMTGGNYEAIFVSLPPVVKW